MKKTPTNPVTKPRPNIAKLSDILRQYRPMDGQDANAAPSRFSLVNEISVIGNTEKVQHAHTVDQLISAMGQAWPEITNMAKELGLSIAMHHNAVKLVGEMYEMVMKFKLAEDRDPLADVSKQATFLRKCEDVMRHIVNSVPPEKAKATAEKFLAEFDPQIPGNIFLVNDKSDVKGTVSGG